MKEGDCWEFYLGVLVWISLFWWCEWVRVGLLGGWSVMFIGFFFFFLSFLSSITLNFR